MKLMYINFNQKLFIGFIFAVVALLVININLLSQLSSKSKPIASQNNYKVIQDVNDSNASKSNASANSILIELDDIIQSINGDQSVVESSLELSNLAK